MRAYDVIVKKRDGGTLSAEEIGWLIDGYTRGEIPDYQVAAWLMAVFWRGMSAEETVHLTMAMARSGETLDLSGIAGIKVDKHSTGGVGDTTTLVLGPAVAAAGVPVAKMSGRALGHTGGTVDKLESIPGLRVELSGEEFVASVNRIKLAVAGQTRELAPADKKLYALRDVTGTVESIPLIAASIMSKKIAAGADRLVLDVKTGRGAFLQTLEDSVRLAEAMVEIGHQVGKPTVALVTDMSQPLGNAVGNALEVREAIDALAGRGPADLVELVLALGAEMLVLAGRDDDIGRARSRLAGILASRAGLAKLREMVAAQGGDPRVVDDPELLPTARLRQPVEAPRGGYVREIDALAIAGATLALGAGRERKDDVVDPAVGVVLRRKVGDPVAAGEPLATVHANDAGRLADAAERVRRAYHIGDAPLAPGPLVLRRIAR